jgi:hypothetical protein
MSSKPGLPRVLCVSLLAIAAASTARAEDLKNFFTDLVVPLNNQLFGGTMNGPGGLQETALFFGNFDPGKALDNLSNSAFSQFQQFPVGSTVAGFTYEFDPALSIFVRSTQGLGPVVVERAQTNGKGKLNVSFGYSRIHYDVFEGTNLDNIDVTLNGTQPAQLAAGNQILGAPDPVGGNNPNSVFLTTTANVNLGPGDSLAFTVSGTTASGPFVTGTADSTAPSGQYQVAPQLPRVKLDGSIDVDYFALLANYGITDSIDVGIVFPIERIDLSGKVTTSGLLDLDAFLNTGQIVAAAPSSTPRSTESKSGIGDIILRGKALLFESDMGDIATRVDVSLPTGNEDDLMGRGNVALAEQLIASETFYGRFSPHVNLGLFFDLGDGKQNQLRYAAGMDIRLHDRITLSGDFLGSHDLESDNIGDNQYSVAGGLKINPWQRLVISGSAIVRLNSQGLRADVIPSGSIEYTFF